MHVTQVWNEKAPEEEVLALVVRTGLHTNMGSMLRQVLTPVIGTDPFVKVCCTLVPHLAYHAYVCNIRPL